MNQQLIYRDGRRYLVDTVPVVVELAADDTGLHVSPEEAAAVIDAARQVRADRHLPDWPNTELSEVLNVRFLLATELADDPFIRAAFAFAVNHLLTDPELAEWLDRMHTEGRAA